MPSVGQHENTEPLDTTETKRNLHIHRLITDFTEYSSERLGTPWKTLLMVQAWGRERAASVVVGREGKAWNPTQIPIFYSSHGINALRYWKRATDTFSLRVQVKIHCRQGNRKPSTLGIWKGFCPGPRTLEISYSQVWGKITERVPIIQT